jgi:hypothetical protein
MTRGRCGSLFLQRDPQSLNLYGYVRNSPLGKTDPDGHAGEDVLKWIAGAEIVAPELTPVIVGGTLGYLAGKELWDNRAYPSGMPYATALQMAQVPG